MVRTGSIFEQDEGAFFALYTIEGIDLGGRPLPEPDDGVPARPVRNPKSVWTFEEPRYLIQSWLKSAIPTVRTPLYVRDNIHVDLIAAAYASFIN